MSRLNYAFDVLNAGNCPWKKKPNSFACSHCGFAKTFFGDSLLCSSPNNPVIKKGETRRKRDLAQPHLFNNGPGAGNGPRF
jgi:hypothetical protein